jgi:hypothetical protein
VRERRKTVDRKRWGSGRTRRGADGRVRERMTGGWLVMRQEYCWLVAGLFCEKSTAGWWLITGAG